MYSFGVLLCENCIRELPDPDRRDEQVAMVTNRVLRALVRRCLQRDPEARPSMEDIIGELEQLVKSEGQVSEMEGQRTNVQGQLQEKDEQLVNSEGRLREMEQQLANVQGQLQEKDEQLVNSEGRLREMEQQMANVQGELKDKDEAAAILQNQVTTFEDRLRTKDQEVNELETSLSAAQRALNDSIRQQSPDWVISRDQIQLTDKCLGRGSRGTVVEGRYCGCAVAVKQIYELILSDYNRRLFEREIKIASICRHPCLLQFIGATNDEGNPLFVTELMESSLRVLLEQRSLSKTEVSVISLDVARALNYLHQKKPSPIIHRDISSANVLLWRQADQWRGKVSDYGTANFMQQTMTVGPGAMIYSAPEAHTKSQTIKVFIFIFFNFVFVFVFMNTRVKMFNHGCHRHQISKFSYFSLMKVKFLPTK